MATEDRKEEQEQECLYKTKVVQFLGRSTPIVLQNDNGPCPLLAICNILLLKNNLNLSIDISEVSLQKLLSLVAERLIDSNCNIENKDAGYVENQQQNISDAIDLLPRLATGIDVNIQFRRIDDFEFTRECAIFDLLDIPLYHGWIVDPQDFDTANAIDSKSYNTIMGELVALETRNTGERESNYEEDSIDFAAATTATLGVPSPSISRARSFDDSPGSVYSHDKERKGDREEEAELLRVLRLSEAHVSTSVGESSSADANQSTMAVSLDDRVGVLADTVEGLSISADCNGLSSSWEAKTREVVHSFSKIDAGVHTVPSKFEESGERTICTDMMENITSDTSVQNSSEPGLDPDIDSFPANKDQLQGPEGAQEVQKMCPQDTSKSELHLVVADNVCDPAVPSDLSLPNAEFDVSCGSSQNLAVPDVVTSNIGGNEPIYEGEECILDSGPTIYENREPMYEGEMVLAEQADRGTIDASEVHHKDEITQREGELIRNFFKNNASQLTIYGLFCLQEGLKERELCVFFRNNHFSTMFKFNGELYLLATDQGYINQPDLVWEKLNEVNGDTVFMTSNFKEFKVENHVNDTWDEQNAMASTADYLASIEKSTSQGSTLNSDLQLAIALQQQEYENQSQRHNSQQSSTSGSSSRLVTGPQAPRSSGSNNASSKQESKSKDKCIVM